MKRTTCCYAKSEKNRIDDPQGVKWDTVLTLGESTVYENEALEPGGDLACCIPASRSAEAEAEGVCCTAAEKLQARERQAACCG